MISKNWCSSLEAIAGGIAEVIQLLCKVVNEEYNFTKHKTIEKDAQLHHADSITMSKLNETIQSCIKRSISDDQYEKVKTILHKCLEEKEIESTKNAELEVTINIQVIEKKAVKATRVLKKLIFAVCQV